MVRSSTSSTFTAASMTDAQVADLVAYLSAAKTGTPVEVSTEAVARARAEQQAILKPPRE